MCRWASRAARRHRASHGPRTRPSSSPHSSASWTGSGSGPSEAPRPGSGPLAAAAARPAAVPRPQQKQKQTSSDYRGHGTPIQETRPHSLPSHTATRTLQPRGPWPPSCGPLVQPPTCASRGASRPARLPLPPGPPRLRLRLRSLRAAAAVLLRVCMTKDCVASGAKRGFTATPNPMAVLLRRLSRTRLMPPPVCPDRLLT